MPHSPPTTEFDDLVKVSPPPAHIAIMPDTKVKVEHIDSSYTHHQGLDSKDEKPMSIGDADVQKMLEDTVRRVREQSDRCVEGCRGSNGLCKAHKQNPDGCEAFCGQDANPRGESPSVLREHELARLGTGSSSRLDLSDHLRSPQLHPGLLLRVGPSLFQRAQLTRSGFLVSSTLFILGVAAVSICLSVLFLILVACKCYLSFRLQT